MWVIGGGRVFAAMKRSLGVGEWVRRGLGVLVLLGVAAIALGLDTGAVLGSAIGFGQVAFNVWGEAVRVAVTMANSAPGGMIQVTQCTYELLRDGYVFRRRGAFWLERLEEAMATARRPARPARRTRISAGSASTSVPAPGRSCSSASSTCRASPSRPASARWSTGVRPGRTCSVRSP